jgi:hypothetical protein
VTASQGGGRPASGFASLADAPPGEMRNRSHPYWHEGARYPVGWMRFACSSSRVNQKLLKLGLSPKNHSTPGPRSPADEAGGGQ